MRTHFFARSHFPRPGQDATTGFPPFQLFDLSVDPAERNNVIADHPDVVRRLGLLMRDYILRGRSTPRPEQENTTKGKWLQTAWIEKFK